MPTRSTVPCVLHRLHLLFVSTLYFTHLFFLSSSSHLLISILPLFSAFASFLPLLLKLLCSLLSSIFFLSLLSCLFQSFFFHLLLFIPLSSPLRRSPSPARHASRQLPQTCGCQSRGAEDASRSCFIRLLSLIWVQLVTNVRLLWRTLLNQEEPGGVLGQLQWTHQSSKWIKANTTSAVWQPPPSKAPLTGTTAAAVNLELVTADTTSYHLVHIDAPSACVSLIVVIDYKYNQQSSRSVYCVFMFYLFSLVESFLLLKTSCWLFWAVEKH